MDLLPHLNPSLICRSTEFNVLEFPRKMGNLKCEVQPESTNRVSEESPPIQIHHHKKTGQPDDDVWMVFLITRRTHAAPDTE